jgi:hypothetical protein
MAIPSINSSSPPPAISQAGTTTHNLSSGLKAALSGLQQGLVAQAQNNNGQRCRIDPSQSGPRNPLDENGNFWGNTRPIICELSAPATEKPAGAPASSPEESQENIHRMIEGMLHQGS